MNMNSQEIVWLSGEIEANKDNFETVTRKVLSNLLLYASGQILTEAYLPSLEKFSLRLRLEMRNASASSRFRLELTSKEFQKCENCKFNSKWEETLGKESFLWGYRCTNPQAPVISTAMEESSNSMIGEEDFYIYRFGCCLWEGK